MHVQLTDIEWLLSRHYFKPARVQRQYIWNVSQCETFHNDLVDAYNSGNAADYYLGPIILAKDEAKDVVWVYDGQQRLTTLTIYMAAIGQIIGGDIQGMVKGLSKVEKGDNFRPRMDLRTRGGALTRIIRNTHTRDHKKNMPVDWRIYEIEKMFLSRLKQIDDLKDFAKWVQHHVFLNTLWANDDRGLILFDRANNRGVKLEWYELVKSVLSEALGPNFKVHTGKRIDDFWYETERDAKNEFSDLLSCTSLIRYKKIDSANALAAFEDDFDTSQKNPEQLEEIGSQFFVALTSYRETSSRLLNLRQWEGKRDKKIRAESELIEFQLLALEFPHWKALIMRADEVGLSGHDRLEFLKQLRRIAFTAHLLGWPNWPSRLDYIFLLSLEKMNNAAGFNDGVGLKRVYFKPEQLQQTKGELSSTMSDPSTYRPLVKLWESAEAYSQGNLDGYAHFFAQVEHILPQAPRGDWCRAFPNEDERVEMRHKLGNLCLLSKGDNFELGNDHWEKKRKLYKKAPKCFVGARTVAQQSDWTPLLVKERTVEIANGVFKLLAHC